MDSATALDRPPGAPAERTPVLAVGTVVWLASELMFFSGLFAAYFTLRATAEEWPPEGVELDAVVSGIFTALLVLSSGTVQLAVRALGRDDRRAFRRWLGVTLVLAAAFVVNQGREWAEAGFRIDTHAYGSAFFVMTGFHSLHVVGGMLAMILLLGRAADRRFGPGDVPAVEVVSYYWHFVDVVWVAMWATLFLLR